MALSVPPAKAFEANMDAAQKKKSLYMWTFQAPLLPELSFAGTPLSNLASLSSFALSASQAALRPSCLQK